MPKDFSPLNCISQSITVCSAWAVCGAITPQKFQSIGNKKKKKIKEHPRVLCTQPPVGRVVLEIKTAMASRKTQCGLLHRMRKVGYWELSGSVSSHQMKSRAAAEPCAAPSLGLNLDSPLGLR